MVCELRVDGARLQAVAERPRGMLGTGTGLGKREPRAASPPRPPASFLPARRATRVDPVEMLRTE
ncbi:MAG: hypothetical protein PVJ02_07425 [Gemmatimonadota bacterium]